MRDQHIINHLAQDKVARVTGGFYVGFILASVLADTLGHIGSGEAQQVYQAILTDTSSFRLGLVIAFMSAFLFLVAAWGSSLRVGLALWLLVKGVKTIDSRAGLTS